MDLANTKTGGSAQRVQISPSSQDKIIDELRLQLMEAQSRIAIAEDDARIARHDASTIRRQYLDRVVDSRGEVNSMLSTQAQQHRQQSRAFGIKLLARQFYLTNKIKPMRKAFFQWFGHISAKQNGIVTKLYSKNLRELEVENIALSRALRASEMSNCMLEGLIASKESSKHQDVQTKIGSISRTQSLRVKMLEHDLSQIRRENQRLKSQHAKYLADQATAMPNHHTQAQLPQMKSISNLMKSGATATASTSPHVSHANTVRTVAGGAQFYDPIESTKINEDLRKRSAEFLGFGILQASREDLGRQLRPTNTKPDNHSPPLDQQKCSRGGKHKPSNDLLDRIHKGHNGKNKLMETNKNQRHSTKRNWNKKGKQRRRKSLLLQKVV